MPIQEANVESKTKAQSTGKLKDYLRVIASSFLNCLRMFIGFVVGAVYIGGIIGAVILLPLYMVGLAMIRFLGLSWLDVVVIEGLVIVHVTALRIGLLWARVRSRRQKMKLRMVGCLFGIHDYGETAGGHWEMIGIDCHIVRVSKCKYCSSKFEEVSLQYW